MARTWKWRVRCFYAKGVKPPKQPGRLAIETIHVTDASKDFELEAANKNDDYGEIVVTPYVKGG